MIGETSPGTGCGSYRRARRRSVLQAGLLGVLGLSLPEYLRLRQAWGAAPCRAESVLVIWPAGGLSHHDTFDPKPLAPPEVRGEFGTLKTSVPGVRFSDRIPMLAREMRRIALVRCAHHREGDHGVATYAMLRGYAQPNPTFDRPENQRNTHPNIGSIIARERGAAKDLPAYVCVPGLGYVAQVNYFTPGWLGPRYAPFLLKADPNDPNFEVQDLYPPRGVTAERARRRHRILETIDGAFRQFDRERDIDAMDTYYQRAYQILSSPPARRAFALEDEPARVRDAYGRTRLGQSCLLARRLIEAGVPFVTVDDDGWDHHENIYPSLKRRLPDLDRAVATLLADLGDRGLLARTLVIFLTDFGRTPTINKGAGRDHWPAVFSIFFAGAGIRGGQVIGSSDTTGAEPVDRAVTPQDIARTIYHFLGIDPATEYLAPDGRPVRYVDGGEAIPQLTQ